MADDLRRSPPTDLDYGRVYGMRADTESLNAQFERAFYSPLAFCRPLSTGTDGNRPAG